MRVTGNQERLSNLSLSELRSQFGFLKLLTGSFNFRRRWQSLDHITKRRVGGSEEF